MSSGSSFGPGLAGLFALAAGDGGRWLDDPLVADRLGGLVADAHAIAVLGHADHAAGAGWRAARAGGQRAQAGRGRPTSRRCRRPAWPCSVRPRPSPKGAGAAWSGGFLGDRALSIAGGTSEIQRNVIAERLLGLPKDP